MNKGIKVEGLEVGQAVEIDYKLRKDPKKLLATVKDVGDAILLVLDQDQNPVRIRIADIIKIHTPAVIETVPKEQEFSDAEIVALMTYRLREGKTFTVTYLDENNQKSTQDLTVLFTFKHSTVFVYGRNQIEIQNNRLLNVSSALTEIDSAPLATSKPKLRVPRLKD